MKNTMKRVLAVLLAMAMVIGLIFPNPMRVKAADDALEVTVTVRDKSKYDEELKEYKIVDSGIEVFAVGTVDSNEQYQFTNSGGGHYSLTLSGDDLNGHGFEIRVNFVDEGLHVENDPLPRFTASLDAGNSISIDLFLAPNPTMVSYTVDASTLFSSITDTYGEKALTGISFTVIEGEGESAVEKGTISSATSGYKYEGSAPEGTKIQVTTKFVDWKYLEPSAAVNMDLILSEGGNNSIVISDSLSTTGMLVKTTAFSPSDFSLSLDKTEIVSGQTATATVSGTTGWKATVTFGVGNDNLKIEQNTTDQTKAVVTGKKVAESASVTATVSIGTGEGITPTVVTTPALSTSVKVTAVPVTLVISRQTPPEGTDYSWKDPVTFNVTATVPNGYDVSKLNGKRVCITIGIPNNPVNVYATLQNGTGTAEVFDPTGKVDKKDKYTVLAALEVPEGGLVIDDIEYKNTDPLASYTYEPAVAPQDTLVYTPTASELTYGQSGTEGAPAVNFVLVGSVSSSTKITDYPQGFVPYTVTPTDNKYADYIKVVSVNTSDNNTIGYIYINPQGGVGNVSFTVTKNGGNSYANATTTQSVTINPYELTAANLPAEYTASDKVYDGTTAITVADASLQGLPYGEQGTLVVTGVTTDANVQGENEAKTVTLSFAAGSAWTTSASNYTGIEDLTATTTAAITKRPLYLVVGNATAEWQNVVSENITEWLGTTISISVKNADENSGFVTGESDTLTGFTYPTVKLDIATSGTSVGDHDNVLYAADGTGDPTNNYQFVYTRTEQAQGTLTITAQSISEVTDFLTIDNLASTNVHQMQVGDDTFVYYSEKDPVAWPMIRDAAYTKVYVVKNNTETDVTTTGVSLDPNVATQIISFILTNDDGTHKTEVFDIEFTRDNTAPEVTITLDTKESVVKDFTKTITFNLFDNLYTGTETIRELEAVMTVSDPEGDGISGIKDWYYVIVNTDKDVAFDDNAATITKDNVSEKFSGITWTQGGTELTETKWIGKVPVKQNADGTIEYDVVAGNYIVFVVATDRVNNTTLYSSQGTIIDDIDMTIISPVYDGMTAKNKPDFFNEDVNLLITVTENTSGIYSGVATLTEIVTQDGVAGEAAVLISADEVDDTLENIKDKYGEITVPSTVVAQDGSKEVTVDYTATDYAGNVITASKSFVIDPVAPEMEMELSSSASRLNGKYYKANVTVTTTITERYLDLANDLVFTINIDGKDNVKKFGELANGQLGITAIKIVKQTDESDDEQQTVVTIEFGEDHEYLVSAAVMDKAGNEADAEADVFVVDKTAPVATVTYYGYGDGSTFTAGTSEATRYYLAGQNGFSSFRAVIAVDELNFSDGKTVNANYKVTAVDSEGAAASGVDTAKYDTDAKAFGSWKNQKYTVDYNADANYTFTFDYTDLAGNPVQLATNYITLDTVAPEGTVTVYNMVNGDASKTWEDLLSTVTFGLFGKDYVGSTMTSKDLTAGVASTQYLTTSELLTKSALAARNDWTDYASALTLAANENVIVYEKVTDKAGNVEYFSSENIVVDNVDPAPVVTITPSVPAWNKGVYAASDNPGFDIEVTDPITNGAYSGLQTITYKITAEGVEETGELASFTKGSHEQSWKGHVNIDPVKFYSNNVEVTVTASDYSTNEATSETRTLKIDSKDPIVSFSFDNSDARNGKYYNREKTLTITIDERNFDPSYEPTVTSTAGGGWSFSGWSTSGETTTGTVTFSGDSDYTVTFDCVDLAGNKSNTENLEEITVDMTNPVITVSYDNNNASNNNYYRSERTATITIVEHNFNAENVTVTITASLNGESIDVPVVSEWDSREDDTHTASVSYPGDGDYTFDIEYVDLAGNDAAEYAGDDFTVDKTAPDLIISGVENKSANNGTVAPVINVNDINFNNSNVTYTLTGVNTGEVDVTNMVIANVTDQGTTITFKNFPDGMDDIYTLTAKAVDMAGNETSRSITFSVNRDGSTYIINDYTKSLIDKGFTNDPKDIVITEINVDTLEFIELSYTKDGQVVKLEEGKDYIVEEIGGEGEWKQYTYTIKASAFAEEGEYSINIYSEDTATNSSTNKAKAMTVDFIVDKTAPTMAVANLEDNGRYQEEAHTFTMTVKDNSVMDKVEIYLNGELWKTVDGKDLAAANGIMDIVLAESGQYQDVQLIAYDAAGNKTEPLNYHVLVTSNGWIQFYNNKPLFGGSIAGIVVVGGGLAALIAKRKKKEEK